MRKSFWGSVFAVCLAASSAGAVELFVPVPYLGGRFLYNTEFVRENTAKVNVNFTFAAEGNSAVGVTPQRLKVLPGPSTDNFHPLLTDNYNRDFHRAPLRSEPKYYLTGGGLAVMQGETGLVGAETAVIVGGDPTSAWELPMLTADDAYDAGATAYVNNLMQSGTTSSHLSIFNVDRTPTRCTTKLRAADGRLLDERQGVVVKALGSVRIPNIVSGAVTGVATGLNVAVTCDRPFYALGSFPSAKIADIRVFYPTPTAPDPGTREILVNGESFQVTRAVSEKRFTLPLVEGARYRSILIDFDVTTAAPPNPAFFRSIVGMWRPQPGRRFGKTLYFGTVERFDRSKIMTDVGTPYIEVLVKRGGAALLSGRTYHFHIEVDADRKSIRQLVTNPAGAVVADINTGLFNDDLATREGISPVVGFGLEGIADGAYSPPFGWKFARIVISAYR
jgi:hypothetical protein